MTSKTKNLASVNKLPDLPVEKSEPIITSGQIIDQIIKENPSLQVVILVESDSRLSPYIYHINDQPYSDQFFILNDKKILKSLTRREPMRTESKIYSTSAQTQQEKSSSLSLDLVHAIKTELGKILMLHQRPNSTSTVSSLVKRGKVRTSAETTSEIYVLISTMYNPNLPRLLIESNVPVCAVIRLVEDEAMSQQAEFTNFYEYYLKEYPFKNRMKRAKTRLSGNCKEDTKDLTADIETFWKSLDIIRKQYPQTFRDTIFADSATPYVNLRSCGGNLRPTLESYRKILYEDIQSVQTKIRDIVQASHCYFSQMKTQKLRTRNKLELEDLTEYKISILTSGSNIPCIVHSIVKQITDFKTPFKPSDSSHQSIRLAEPSKMVLQPKEILTETENSREYHLTSVLFRITNELDDFYIIHEAPPRINIFHARDDATFCLLLHNGNRNTYEITMRLLRTFVTILTQDYFSICLNGFSNKFIKHAKSFIHKSLTNPIQNPGYVQKFAYKSFNNKRFYLSYYLSLPLLELKTNSRKIVPDQENIDIVSVPSASLQDDCNLEDEYQATTVPLGVKSNHVINLEQKIKDIQHRINHSILTQHHLALYNYTENFAPDAMMQLVFSRVASADRVSLTRLHISGDVLIQCFNESHPTSKHRFCIHTVVGLSDFYHHFMASDHHPGVQDFLVCPRTETPSSQPSSDRCRPQTPPVNMFLLPDSIKYEQSFVQSDIIEDENSGEQGTISSEVFGQGFTHAGYKYGIPQLVENNSSVLVHWFDKNARLEIKKSAWSQKHFEYISVACHIKSYITGNITQSNEHIVYNHIKRDTIHGSILSCDFHIRSNTDMLISFKKNTFPDRLTLNTESYEQIDHENLSMLDQSYSDFGVNDLIYDQSIEMLNKFALFSPDYFPILCCPSGLTIDITNDSAYPFCIQQYFTLRAVFPCHVRKYLLNACVLCSSQDDDNIVVMSATGETFLSNKSILLGENENVIWTMKSPEGDLYTFQDGSKTFLEHCLNVTMRENLENNSLCMKREDGLIMQFCEDSTLHVVYPDGTHFMTCVSVDSDMQDPDCLGFVFVNMTIQISHADYFTVFYNIPEAILTIKDGMDFELNLHTNGSYKIRLDAVSSLKVNSDYFAWEMIDMLCSDVTDRFEFEFDSATPEATLISLQNVENELKVDFTGYVSAYPNPWGQCDETCTSDQSLFSKMESSPVNDPYNASSILVLSADFSGFEILSSAEVESLLTLVKLDRRRNSNDSITVQALDSLFPYFSTFISRCLSQVSRNPPMCCTPQDCLPSTYGAGWWYPFHSKVDALCPSPHIQGWTYRLLHRITRSMDDIMQLFRQANDPELTSDFEPEDPVEDSQDMMERICLGNVTLNSVREDDVVFIRKCVVGMVKRAIMMVNIAWVHEQNRKLLDFLSHRPKPAKKKICPKPLPPCQIMARQCFADNSS